MEAPSSSLPGSLGLVQPAGDRDCQTLPGEGGNSTPLQQLILVSWQWLLFLLFLSCRWCLPVSGVLKPPAHGHFPTLQAGGRRAESLGWQC